MIFWGVELHMTSHSLSKSISNFMLSSSYLPLILKSCHVMSCHPIPSHQILITHLFWFVILSMLSWSLCAWHTTCSFWSDILHVHLGMACYISFWYGILHIHFGMIYYMFFWNDILHVHFSMPTLNKIWFDLIDLMAPEME